MEASGKRKLKRNALTQLKCVPVQVILLDGRRTRMKETVLGAHILGVALTTFVSVPLFP